MILTWSKHQQGHAADVIDYLILDEIFKSLTGQRLHLVRSPEPEVLDGSPKLVATFIDQLRFRKKYRCATLSFHEHDIDVAAFERGDPGMRGKVDAAVSLFLEVAFAGVLKPARPPVLVSTHTHLGRLEVSILMPRAINSETGLRSFNPHPPTRGSEADWDAYVDVVNFELGWEDPRCPLRRQQVTPPQWMKKVAAEISRRQDAGEGVALPREDPRFAAWAACEDAVMAGLHSRDERVDYINQRLAPIGWAVHRLWDDGLTCGPLDGGGRKVRFQGAVLGDGVEAGIDPFDASVARAEEVLTAPTRLAAAMKKRSVQNARLSGTAPVALPAPRDVLKGARPLLTLATRLARLIDCLRDRLAQARWWLLLGQALHSVTLSEFHTIGQKLERLHDPRPDHAGAQRPHRNPDQPLAAPAGARHGTLGGAHGSVPGGTSLHPQGNDLSGGKDGSGGGQVETDCDLGGSGVNGEASERPNGVAGAEAGFPMRSAQWRRGHWLIFVGKLARAALGPCTLSWRVTAGLEEAVIRTPQSALSVAIDRARPDEDWRAALDDRLQAIAYDKPDDHSSEADFPSM